MTNKAESASEQKKAEANGAARLPYGEITAQVTQLTAKVRQFILTEFNRFSREDIEYKGRNDMVSYVDKEAEKQLVTGLRAILPQEKAGIIAEEGTGEAKEGGYNWVIDPLDGTTNFVHGVPIFAISIALVNDKLPVIGVVHEIVMNECFSAWQGGGCFLNDRQVHVSPEKELGAALVATGYPYNKFELVDNYMAILRLMMHESHGLRRLGSAAIDLAYVACGRFEGFFEHNLRPWDVAGGALLVQEAGGKVTDFTGGDNFVFGGELIAAGHVHRQMQNVIENHFFTEQN